MENLILRQIRNKEKFSLEVNEYIKNIGGIASVDGITDTRGTMVFQKSSRNCRSFKRSKQIFKGI
jgi:hypothetical protein